jgi:hypothetical protein
MQHNIPRLYQMNRLRHDVDLSNFIIYLCIVNVNQRKKDDTESLFELYPFIKNVKAGAGWCFPCLCRLSSSSHL